MPCVAGHALPPTMLTRLGWLASGHARWAARCVAQRAAHVQGCSPADGCQRARCRCRSPTDTPDVAWPCAAANHAVKST
eukprot:2426975-Alexandrium_andersonii.AAC.1